MHEVCTNMSLGNFYSFLSNIHINFHMYAQASCFPLLIRVNLTWVTIVCAKNLCENSENAILNL